MPTKKTKKTVTKKTVKPAVKRAVRVEPTMPEMHACACGAECKCGCKCGKFKKFIVLFIVFCIGFAVAKFTCCHGMRHHMRGMPEMQPVFVNGCLDMESVKCPKMQELLKNADVNADECISIEEFDAIKPERKHRR